MCVCRRSVSFLGSIVVNGLPKGFGRARLAVDRPYQSYVNIDRETPLRGINKAARRYVFGGERLWEPRNAVPLSRHRQ